MSSITEKVKSVFGGSVPHEQAKVTHAKKVLLCVTAAAPQMPDHKSGYFWAELLHPWEAFTAAGWDCDVCSETGTASVDESSIGSMASASDRAKWDDKEFPLKKKIDLGLLRADQVDLSKYAAIYFAGGHACVVDFPHATNLKRLAAQLYEQGGIVGAVCHGPAIFDGLNLSNGRPLLQGMRATGFTNKGEAAMGATPWLQSNGYLTMQQVVEKNGGQWEENDQDPMADFTLAHDRLVTGMNPASAKSLATKMISLMDQRENELGVPGSKQANEQVVKEQTRAYAGEQR